MPKLRIVYFDVGFLPTRFGFTTDVEGFERERKRLGIEDPRGLFDELPMPAATWHFTRKQDGGVSSIVCLDLKACRQLTSTQISGLLAHEAVHVWQEACHFMCEDAPGREIEAYAIQYFTQCMLSELERKPS